MHEVTTGGGDIPHLTSDGLGRPRYERVLAADVSISGGVLHVVSELGVISAAVADGHVDDQEAAHITVACDRAIEALAAVRSQAAGRVRGAA